MTQLEWHHGPQGRSSNSAILLHGFGANGRDLVALARELDPNQHYSWHFPQAPIPLFPGSFAWFPRAPQQLQAALEGSLFSHLAEYNDPSIWQACATLQSDIVKLGLLPNLQLIGGFSQGSMMALLLALDLEQLIPTLLLFSSNLVARAQIIQRLDQKTGSKSQVFMSHGQNDSVLPLTGAVALRNLLESHGYPVVFETFVGGHEIPTQAIVAAQKLMQI